MTRLEIIQHWARFFGKNATTLDTLTKQRCLDYLNVGQRTLLSQKRFAHLRDVTIPLSSVADQADYVLVGVSKILRIWDTTNRRFLWEMSEQMHREANINTMSGTPEAFVRKGLRATAKDPSDASELFIDSTSASDTNTLYFEGIITGGYPRSGSVTMTGTTAVSLSTSITSWVRIDKLYLSAAAVGTVTLHEDASGGTELARITIGQTSADYQGLTLWQTPSSVNAYLLDVTRNVTDFAQDTDVPILPLDFHDLLLLRAKRDECLHLNDQRYAAVRDEYESRENELAYWVAESATGQPYGLGLSMQRPSVLGSYYPAGS